MSLSAIRSVSDAIDRTRSLLLPPGISRWGLLTVIAAFLGTAGTPLPANPQFLDPRLWEGLEPPATQTGATPEIALPSVETGLAGVPQWVVLVGGGIAVIGIGYLLVGVLMRFVFVRALLTDDIAVLAPARRSVGSTVQIVLFRGLLWSLGVVPVAFVFQQAVDLGPTLGATTVSLPGTPVLGALGLLGAVVFSIDTATMQLVIPLMVKTELSVLGAWQQLITTVTRHWQEYLAYAIVRLVLGVAVGIIAAGAILLAGLGLVVVFGTVGGLVVIASGGLAGLGTVGTVLLGGVGLLFVGSLLIVVPFVNMPFQTYLWYYTLLVLADTDDQFELPPHRERTAGQRDPIV